MPSTISLKCRPRWAEIRTGNLAQFPVVPGLRALLVGVDRDPAGESAAQQCAARWRAAGRRVLLVRPDPQDNDLNDTVQRYAGNE